LCVAVVGAALSCHKERAPVEELYTTRMVGLSYLQRNQLPEAESAFKKLTTLAPQDPLGYASLGLTYLQAGRYADAEKQLQRARELEPGSTEIGLALAKVYSLTGRATDARALLGQLQKDTTGNARVLYALAELESSQSDSASAVTYRARLRDVLAVAPANLAARLKLVDALARAGDTDSAIAQLEEVRRIPPEPPAEARAYLDSSIQLMRAKNVAGAQKTLQHLFSLMEVTTPYQASLQEVQWTQGPIPGRPILTFAPKSFVSIRGVRERATVDLAKFVDVTDEAGLASVAPSTAASSNPDSAGQADALAIGDIDGDGTDDLFVSTWSPSLRQSVVHLFRVQGGFVRDATGRSGIALPKGAEYATFADFDNDGWLDLFAIGAEGRGYLFRNRGDGTFVDVTPSAGVADVKGARRALFVDLDHDGDLDLLLVGGAGRKLYRNNLDGTFTDATASFGLAGGSARDAAFGDFDGDGRVDVIIASETGGEAILHNGGAQHFLDASAASGLTDKARGSGALAVADYNNDGFLDLFVAAMDGSEPQLWLNKGDGTFKRDLRSSGLPRALSATPSLSATFMDYDNDGWLDLLVARQPGTSRSSPNVFLFRNEGTGKFVDRSNALPASVRAAGALSIAVSDVDEDGDEDLFLIDGNGAPRLLRNDFGNSNLAVNVELKGLRNGSGKNNAFGIGARLEL
jgi:Flp pilus assembly protein TadD